jgi:hypothetical protein
MREIRTSGSVGDGDGNVPIYPATSASTFLAFTALFVGGEPLNPIQ